MFYSKKILCILCIIFSMSIGGITAYFTFLNDEKIKINTAEIDSEYKKETTDSLVENDLIPINAELTAYCNCELCSEEWGSNTAMQTQTRIGVVAAPKEIPLGSKIYIPLLNDYTGDGIFDVEDRGGAVKIKDDGSYIIDVWLSNHDDVIEFGRKKSTIYLIEE
ncbi:MAG: hypothetical protein E7208_02470 [Clostridium butyricum]|nr:hypothetical protein [Clostridium butyricum]